MVCSYAVAVRGSMRISACGCSFPFRYGVFQQPIQFPIRLGVDDNKRHGGMVLLHSLDLGFAGIVHPAFHLVLFHLSVVADYSEVRQVAHAPSLDSLEPKCLWLMGPCGYLPSQQPPLQEARVVGLPSRAVEFSLAADNSPRRLPSATLSIWGKGIKRGCVSYQIG